MPSANLRITLESRYSPSHGPGPQPLCPRRRATPARARRPRCRAAGFDVLLERVATARPERSIVLTGLRGVGKTVLLNALRCAAVRRGWGTGKLEARPGQSLRRPLAAALHLAVRELAAPAGCRVRHVLGVVKAFAQREPRRREAEQAAVAARHRRPGRHRTGRLRRHRDRPGRAVHRRRRPGRRHRPRHRACSSTRCRTSAPTTCRRCARPATRSPSRACRWSWSAPACRTCRPCCRRPSPTPSGCSATPASTGSTAPPPTPRCRCPRATRTPSSTTTRSPRCIARPAATPTSSRPTARPPGTSRRARRSPQTDVAVAAPEAESELAVGFFGSRYERATPAEREYLRAMAEVADRRADEPVPTAAVADTLGRPPQSLSPARDALLKKGLVYSGQRGRIAFTVPHFGRYLRELEPTARTEQPAAACWRIQACIAMPAATPALIERVEPYCAIEHDHRRGRAGLARQARTLLAEQQQRVARQRERSPAAPRRAGCRRRPPCSRRRRHTRPARRRCRRGGCAGSGRSPSRRGGSSAAVRR